MYFSVSQEMNTDYVRSKFLDSHKNVVESLVKNDHDLTNTLTHRRDEGGGGKTFATQKEDLWRKAASTFLMYKGQTSPSRQKGETRGSV